MEVKYERQVYNARDYKKKMAEQLQNQFNMMKRAEEAAIYETDTLKN